MGATPFRLGSVVIKVNRVVDNVDSTNPCVLFNAIGSVWLVPFAAEAIVELAFRVG